MVGVIIYILYLHLPFMFDKRYYIIINYIIKNSCFEIIHDIKTYYDSIFYDNYNKGLFRNSSKFIIRRILLRCLWLFFLLIRDPEVTQLVFDLVKDLCFYASNDILYLIYIYLYNPRFRGWLINFFIFTFILNAIQNFWNSFEDTNTYPEEADDLYYDTLIRYLLLVAYISFIFILKHPEIIRLLLKIIIWVFKLV